ncbi:sigma-54-dependent Fis family transcriptional regulator [Nitrogeniibacter mangrovi]|uniref:Sigma-54-dependent Fis family transcriptional regulator n=1 Tax=Nitrogeniibacter mangrovi TaxID=2016596 RepID=A0A6C1AY20_9RHOO|nr:sigma-54 dependent transcriptional regulator [Nitrogeniibacter mangrovi]QID16237.1 sigma-54-dependent Fis family transcriptional regulator [Nitrogeniibacter mangrovi]
MTQSILLVEDDDTLRSTVAKFLARQGFEVDTAADGATALERLAARRFAVTLLDLHLPDMSGLDVITRTMAAVGDGGSAPLFVVMTAYPEVRTAVASLKAGAYDYINKPFDLEDLRELIRRVLETHQLRREVAWRRAQAKSASTDELRGGTAVFLDMLETTHKVAAAGKVPVLIRGESGVGKEKIAHTIHERSMRAGGPWVTLNCASLPEGLLESELFGHERGAFTDAKQTKRGLLELADGGTLFLDEIGDLAPALQPKLLRVLETQRFRRLGGQAELSVDVRFVAATHRDLRAMTRDGSFREDLYFRLNVAAIDIPPLRERQEDILTLARHFLEQVAPEIGIEVPRIAADVPPLLLAYRWPGNIRELRNVMERAAILSGGDTIEVRHLPKELHDDGEPGAAAWPGDESAIRPLSDFEADYIAHVLYLCGGNKTQAAALLGVTRATLRNKLAD